VKRHEWRCCLIEKETSAWLLPSSISFEHLKGHDLEECVYWLMDSLGAKDLEWRVGGVGAGTADGGRDLEARFFSPSPDGEMEETCWWIECKGRARTVEPSAVKDACSNALAHADLSVLVIVTNSTFSNPTRDWVRDWQRKHPVPKIKLWDKSSLERMLSRHPNAVYRLFSQALSTTGHLEVAREGFWNRFDFASPTALAKFWSERETLEIGPLERIALVVSEFAHGRIVDRPWGVSGSGQGTIEALALVMANLPYLFGRAVRGGFDQEPLIRGVGYLVLSALRFCSAGGAATIMEDQLVDGEGEPWPPEVRELLLEPILGSLLDEVRDACTADCRRFLIGKGDAYGFDNAPLEHYWKRLDPKGRQIEDASDEPQLWLQKNDEPCKVGFDVGPSNGCPLFADEREDLELLPLLKVIEKVSDFRSKDTASQD
jgi:hypothetical protein